MKQIQMVITTHWPLPCLSVRPSRIDVQMRNVNKKCRKLSYTRVAKRTPSSRGVSEHGFKKSLDHVDSTKI